MTVICSCLHSSGKGGCTAALSLRLQLLANSHQLDLTTPNGRTEARRIHYQTLKHDLPNACCGCKETLQQVLETLAHERTHEKEHADVHHG